MVPERATFIVLNSRESGVLYMGRSVLEAFRVARRYVQYRGYGFRRGLAFGWIVPGPSRTATIVRVNWHKEV